jgi:hypothetical protein
MKNDKQEQICIIFDESQKDANFIWQNERVPIIKASFCIIHHSNLF